MYSHTRRWKEAQKREVGYWRKEYFRDSEFKELAAKYSDSFAYMEKKYNFCNDTKILDLGCGATCPSILFKSGEKYGVDPLVGDFLEKDKEKLSGRIRLFKGTGEEIPFGNNFFDVVLCRNALDHMDSIQKVMEEIKRVTKRQGIILLATYTYTPFIAFLKRTSEYIPLLRNVEHPLTFTPVQFKDFCAEYFQILEENIIFEGKSSINYGKQDVELKEPSFHKIAAWLNRYIFMNHWFLREYLIICRKT